MKKFTTIIVEDSEDYRRYLVSTLQQKTQCLVVKQASDGLTGVRHAAELQPDLIILDLGLPKLNGMEAARQIRKLAPQSKILFVSQVSSVEIVEAALSLGARGYLLKSDGAELPMAVDAVLQGRPFVSNRFAQKLVVSLSSFEALSQ